MSDQQHDRTDPDAAQEGAEEALLGDPDQVEGGPEERASDMLEQEEQD